MIYEFGAGTGKLAIDILGELQALDALPERYCIVDLSPDLIERQQHNIRQALPRLADRVQWLSQLPERLDGVIIGNEVLDAMPCELIRWSPEAQQRGVALDGERFVWEDRPIQDPQLLQLARPSSRGTTTMFPKSARPISASFIPWRKSWSAAPSCCWTTASPPPSTITRSAIWAR